MSDNQVVIEPMDNGFAGAMNIFTYVGLIPMVISGILYFFDVGGKMIDMQRVAAYWGQSATFFWKSNGIEIHGYGWFLNNLHYMGVLYMDMLCILGCALLGLVPAFSILVALVKAKGPYKLLLTILFLEFAFAIFRPLIMPGGGG